MLKDLMVGTEAMLLALKASGPDLHHEKELMLFGQFVGSWDVDVINIKPDGSGVELKAEWHFGWVLQGRAIMDVWIAPKRSMQGSAEPYEYGATIRFYDPDIKAWRSTWIGPVRHLVRPFIARQLGEEIVLEGSFASGTMTRWIFSAITVNTFKWRNVESGDNGKTWNEIQRMTARRIEKQDK
jgi:hypothetical protein